MSTTVLEPHTLIETPSRTAPARASADAIDAGPIPESREIAGDGTLEEIDPYRAVLCCGRNLSRP
jgi:hypothetical protein